MGNGFWNEGSSTHPFMGDTLSLILGGAVYDGSGYAKPVESNSAENSPDTWGLFAGAQLRALVAASSPQTQYSNGTGDIVQFTDFGILYAAAMANYGGPNMFDAYVVPGQEDGHTRYVKGPFWRASEKIDDVWNQRNYGGSGSEVGRDVSPEGSYFTGSFPTGYTVPGIDTLIDAYKQTALPTETWFSSVHGEWEEMLSALEDGLTIPSVETSVPSYVDKSFGTHSAGTIAEPSSVTVADNIDDAVAAYTALAETRFAQDEARLRASLFSTRAMMSTAFDNAMAILSANKNAQITDFEKQARMEQAKMQAQADMEHVKNLMEREARNEQFALDAFRANIDADAKEAEINLAGMRTVVEANLKKDEIVASIYNSVVSARAGVLGQIYAFINTGASASASLVSNWVSANLQASSAKTAAHIDKWRTHYEIRERVSNAQFNLAELRWKAQIQRLMIMKEAISAFQPGMGGTVENHPSGFQKVESGIGLLAGIASTGIQSALALMG